MPKLIRINRRFGVLSRRLVTDAGGAPCCCGSAECCDQSLPCTPVSQVVCSAGVYRRASCGRSAKNILERVTVQYARRFTFTTTNGYSTDIAISATFLGTLCRAAPSFAVSAVTPLSLSGFQSYRESGPGFAFTQEDGGEVYGADALSSLAWPLQTLSGGPRRVLSVVGDVSVPDRASAFGAGLSFLGDWPGVGDSRLFPPIGGACTGSRLSEGQGFRVSSRWAVADACGAGVTIDAAFDDFDTSRAGGVTTTQTSSGQLIVSGTRVFCECDGSNPDAIGGCAGCGDASLLQIL